MNATVADRRYMPPDGLSLALRYRYVPLGL